MAFKHVITSKFTISADYEHQYVNTNSKCLSYRPILTAIVVPFARVVRPHCFQMRFCPSVCRSHSWSQFKISKHILHHTIERCFWFLEAKFPWSRVISLPPNEWVKDRYPLSMSMHFLLQSFVIWIAFLCHHIQELQPFDNSLVFWPTL